MHLIKCGPLLAALDWLLAGPLPTQDAESEPSEELSSE